MRPPNHKILEFMLDLVDVQRKHDLWLEASEDCPLIVNNDRMGEDIKMSWECQGEPSEGREHLIAILEPDRLTTEDSEKKSPHSSVSLAGTTPGEEDG